MSFVVWVWAVGIFSAAGGQSTSYGELFGVVRDSQGLLVPGASVSVSGANVLGAQETFTDRHGSYHFRALFPGELSLTVEMDGFETVERGGIIVRTGATVVVDITLQPAGIAEQVTVTAAQLDRRTTRVGVSYEGEVVNAVPSSTDLWGVLAQSPGIRMRGYDVGGSHKATQTRYETFGIRGQNRIVSDGVDSTEGNESAGIYYDFYSVEEFQVSTAGADVEMTSPGASVVMTAKSGGDALSGLLHLDYEGSGMVGDNNSPELEERGFTGNHNLLFWEAHADLGGPIVEGRAWFYAAYNHFRLDRKVSGVEPDVASDDASFNNFTGKFTWALSPRDRLIGYSQWGRKERRHLGVSSRLPPESTRDQDGWGWEHKLEWQRSWSERAFGTVKLAHFGYRFDFTPNSDPETHPYDSTAVRRRSPGPMASSSSNDSSRR